MGRQQWVKGVSVGVDTVGNAGGDSRCRPHDPDACSSREVLLSKNGDGRDERGHGMTARADRSTQNDQPDLAVEEEALERYYRRRIREIDRDERPDGGRFIPIEEVRRVADEHESARHP